ncbi:hypothetical protein AARI_30380 [Glutamicibacter arilaitensis Re117]|uniref:Uncharacterized protein n=1 Tax=Glutamicibacter arilaitensis (strain DSM 16368 / CIP 108037 / IAM 15318 / JCM 13566 / NCIMB 14258 / Re117) TaxID=861360 RepID=A0ABM9Q0K2_GLUAR|nr:hypothetical protein [Glutamicibacter arilaitensis]CBT77240.1 hypothetical protein AARI_30380 [Glutamicibacter arilaitensis Re117]
MRSSYELITKAQNIGRYAADLAHDGSVADLSTSAHHPGDDTGRVVLEAYRKFGATSVRDVLEAYQSGYNNKAADLGDPVVRMIQIKNGIHYALPGATDEEIKAIKDQL